MLLRHGCAGSGLLSVLLSVRRRGDREHFLRLIDMGIDRMGVGYRSVPVVLGQE